MKLKKITENIIMIDKKNYYSELEVTSIVYNSKEAEKNSLFIAIKGYQSDGHHYIAQAINAGASVIIHEKNLKDYKNEIAYIKVVDSRETLGKISKSFYDDPSKDLSVTGITGTNGKTSTSFMLKAILETAGEKTGLFGTINNYIGSEVLDNKGSTTPESLEMQKIMKKMKNSACHYVVMEASSQGLYLKRVVGTNFDYGIFTNLTRDHLDFHKTFENYFNAKLILFNMVKKAIINGDDSWGERLYHYLKIKRKIPTYTYGIKGNYDFVAKDLNYKKLGTEFTLKFLGHEERIFINIPGKVMVYNALAAISLTSLEGISMAYIKKALANLPIIKGRMEKLDVDLPFDIMIDFAHSPDSLEQLLETIKKLYKQRIVLVFGAVGDRDKGKRPIMGKIAGRLADRIVITSDSPASEEPLDIIKEIEEGVLEYTRHYHIKKERWEGIKLGVQLCKSGDILIIAGRGPIKSEILKNEIRYYSDYDAVENAVAELKKQGEKINV